MKLLFTLPLVSSVLLLSGLSEAKEYILDKKDQPLPTDYVFEKTSTMSSEDGKLTLNQQGQEMKGTLENAQQKKEERKIISPTKYRSHFKSFVAKGKVTINGRTNNVSPKAGALLNVPVIMEKKEGKWTARLEKGEFTEAQQKEADELAKQENLDESMYGYAPRKIGDKWDTDLKAFQAMVGDGELTKGKATVEFLSVEDYQGQKCAKLLVNLDVEGTKDGNAMKMQGKVTLMRRLDVFLDINVKGKLKFEMDMEPQPGIKMNMQSNMNIKEEILVKVPVK